MAKIVKFENGLCAIRYWFFATGFVYQDLTDSKQFWSQESLNFSRCLADEDTIRGLWYLRTMKHTPL